METRSLVDDASLLCSLEEFSATLLQRVTAVQERLDGLLKDSSGVQHSLESVENQLMLISNTRFVEAQVNTDDSTSHVPGTQEQTKTVCSPDADKENILEAIKNGIGLLETAFDPLDISDTDSESDTSEIQDSLWQLEPRDPYINRPLPYIIGTAQFEDDDYIGLRCTMTADIPRVHTDEELTDEENQDLSLDSARLDCSGHVEFPVIGIRDAEVQKSDQCYIPRRQAVSRRVTGLNAVSIDTSGSSDSEDSDLYVGDYADDHCSSTCSQAENRTLSNSVEQSRMPRVAQPSNSNTEYRYPGMKPSHEGKTLARDSTLPVAATTAVCLDNIVTSSSDDDDDLFKPIRRPNVSTLYDAGINVGGISQRVSSGYSVMSHRTIVQQDEVLLSSSDDDVFKSVKAEIRSKIPTSSSEPLSKNRDTVCNIASNDVSRTDEDKYDVRNQSIHPCSTAGKVSNAQPSAVRSQLDSSYPRLFDSDSSDDALPSSLLVSASSVGSKVDRHQTLEKPDASVYFPKTKDGDAGFHPQTGNGKQCSIEQGTGIVQRSPEPDLPPCSMSSEADAFSEHKVDEALIDGEFSELCGNKSPSVSASADMKVPGHAGEDVVLRSDSVMRKRPLSSRLSGLASSIEQQMVKTAALEVERGYRRPPGSVAAVGRSSSAAVGTVAAVGQSSSVAVETAAAVGQSSPVAVETAADVGQSSSVAAVTAAAVGQSSSVAAVTAVAVGQSSQAAAVQTQSLYAATARHRVGPEVASSTDFISNTPILSSLTKDRVRGPPRRKPSRNNRISSTSSTAVPAEPKTTSISSIAEAIRSSVDISPPRLPSVSVCRSDENKRGTESQRQVQIPRPPNASVRVIYSSDSDEDLFHPRAVSAVDTAGAPDASCTNEKPPGFTQAVTAERAISDGVETDVGHALPTPSVCTTTTSGDPFASACSSYQAVEVIKSDDDISRVQNLRRLDVASIDSSCSNTYMPSPDVVDHTIHTMDSSVNTAALRTTELNRTSLFDSSDSDDDLFHVAVPKTSGVSCKQGFSDGKTGGTEKYTVVTNVKPSDNEVTTQSVPVTKDWVSQPAVGQGERIMDQFGGEVLSHRQFHSTGSNAADSSLPVCTTNPDQSASNKSVEKASGGCDQYEGHQWKHAASKADIVSSSLLVDRRPKHGMISGSGIGHNVLSDGNTVEQNVSAVKPSAVCLEASSSTRAETISPRISIPQSEDHSSLCSSVAPAKQTASKNTISEAPFSSSDDDDLFSIRHKSNVIQTGVVSPHNDASKSVKPKSNVGKSEGRLRHNEPKVTQSAKLFSDDDDDDLFTASSTRDRRVSSTSSAKRHQIEPITTAVDSSSDKCAEDKKAGSRVLSARKAAEKDPLSDLFQE